MYKPAAQVTQTIKPWATLWPLQVEASLDKLVEAYVFTPGIQPGELEQIREKQEEEIKSEEKAEGEGGLGQEEIEEEIEMIKDKSGGSKSLSDQTYGK